MSTDVRAFGTLKFESVEDMVEAEEGLAVEDDEPTADVRQLLTRAVVRKGRMLRLTLHGNVTADANLVFQTWLEDVAEGAASGHLNTWQESFGEASFVRLHAGGREERVEGAFPHRISAVAAH